MHHSSQPSNKHSKPTLLVFLLLGFYAISASADIAVIVHSKNDVKLDREEIKNIFLAKKNIFPNGTLIKPVDQSEGNLIRNEFYQKIAGKSESDMKVYWSNLIFTGYGVPLKAFQDDQAVKNFVKETTNAVGYIDSKSVDASVKTIFTLK